MCEEQGNVSSLKEDNSQLKQGSENVVYSTAENSEHNTAQDRQLACERK